MRSTRMIMWLAPVFILHATIVCTDNDHHDEYDYDRPLGIDTILSRDTVGLHDSVMVVFTYPAGCNGLKSLTCRIVTDTIAVSLIWNYYYHGAPCAHGSGVDSAALSLDFPFPGAYTLAYIIPDSTEVKLRMVVL